MIHFLATGSSRRPALANGCFQIRISHGSLSLDGTLPMFP
jgi:Asp-tRNA(Asn)/Glu-tRNA(Gln) amidotransferase A subunit family amidase